MIDMIEKEVVNTIHRMYLESLITGVHRLRDQVSKMYIRVLMGESMTDLKASIGTKVAERIDWDIVRYIELWAPLIDQWQSEGALDLEVYSRLCLMLNFEDHHRFAEKIHSGKSIPIEWVDSPDDVKKIIEINTTMYLWRMHKSSVETSMLELN